jgi:hypothetical protein
MRLMNRRLVAVAERPLIGVRPLWAYRAKKDERRGWLESGAA